MTIYSITPEFMIEDGENGRRRWGRWDAVFGLWDENGILVAPVEPILGRLGLWLEPLEADYTEQWHQSRLVLAAYWSLIPTSVRLTASKMPGRQWNALQSMWENGANPSIDGEKTVLWPALGEIHGKQGKMGGSTTKATNNTDVNN